MSRALSLKEKGDISKPSPESREMGPKAWLAKHELVRGWRVGGGGVARHTSRQSQVLSGNGPDRQDVALRAVEAQEQPWPTAQRLGQRAGPARRVKLMERGLHTRLEA